MCASNVINNTMISTSQQPHPLETISSTKLSSFVKSDETQPIEYMVTKPKVIENDSSQNVSEKIILSPQHTCVTKDQNDDLTSINMAKDLSADTVSIDINESNLSPTLTHRSNSDCSSHSNQSSCIIDYSNDSSSDCDSCIAGLFNESVSPNEYSDEDKAKPDSLVIYNLNAIESNTAMSTSISTITSAQQNNTIANDVDDSSVVDSSDMDDYESYNSDLTFEDNFDDQINTTQYDKEIMEYISNKSDKVAAITKDSPHPMACLVLFAFEQEPSPDELIFQPELSHIVPMHKPFLLWLETDAIGEDPLDVTDLINQRAVVNRIISRYDLHHQYKYLFLLDQYIRVNLFHDGVSARRHVRFSFLFPNLTPLSNLSFQNGKKTLTHENRLYSGGSSNSAKILTLSYLDEAFFNNYFELIEMFNNDVALMNEAKDNIDSNTASSNLNTIKSACQVRHFALRVLCQFPELICSDLLNASLANSIMEPFPLYDPLDNYRFVAHIKTHIFPLKKEVHKLKFGMKLNKEKLDQICDSLYHGYNLPSLFELFNRVSNYIRTVFHKSAIHRFKKLRKESLMVNQDVLDQLDNLYEEHLFHHETPLLNLMHNLGSIFDTNHSYHGLMAVFCYRTTLYRYAHCLLNGTESEYVKGESLQECAAHVYSHHPVYNIGKPISGPLVGHLYKLTIQLCLLALCYDPSQKFLEELLKINVCDFDFTLYLQQALDIIDNELHSINFERNNRRNGRAVLNGFLFDDDSDDEEEFFLRAIDHDEARRNFHITAAAENHRRRVITHPFNNNRALVPSNIWLTDNPNIGPSYSRADIAEMVENETKTLSCDASTSTSSVTMAAQSSSTKLDLNNNTNTSPVNSIELLASDLNERLSGMVQQSEMNSTSSTVTRYLSGSRKSTSNTAFWDETVESIPYDIPITLQDKRALLERLKSQGMLFLAPPNNRLQYRECGVCCEVQWVLVRNCCEFPSCVTCLHRYYTDRIEMGNLSIECIGFTCHELVYRAEVNARLSPEKKALYSRMLLAQSDQSNRSKPCPQCNTILTITTENEKHIKPSHKRFLRSTKQLVLSGFGLRNKKPLTAQAKNSDNKISQEDNSEMATENSSSSNTMAYISESLVVKVQCARCNFLWCFKCHSPWHEGLSCKQFRKGDTLFKTWAQNVDFNGQVNAQKCPKCKVYIQRTSGCDHMLCIRCKTDFCYKCGDKLRQVKFFGDHYSRLSVLGCKYRYKPNQPFQRRFIRGTVFSGKLMLLPVLSTVCLCAGAVLLALGVAALPLYGGVRVYRRMRRDHDNTRETIRRLRTNRRRMQLRPVEGFHLYGYERDDEHIHPAFDFPPTGAYGYINGQRRRLEEIFDVEDQFHISRSPYSYPIWMQLSNFAIDDGVHDNTSNRASSLPLSDQDSDSELDEAYLPRISDILPKQQSNFATRKFSKSVQFAKVEEKVKDDEHEQEQTHPVNDLNVEAHLVKDEQEKNMAVEASVTGVVKNEDNNRNADDYEKDNRIVMVESLIRKMAIEQNYSGSSQ